MTSYRHENGQFMQADLSRFHESGIIKVSYMGKAAEGNAVGLQLGVVS